MKITAKTDNKELRELLELAEKTKLKHKQYIGHIAFNFWNGSYWETIAFSGEQMQKALTQNAQEARQEVIKCFNIAKGIREKQILPQLVKYPELSMALKELQWIDEQFKKELDRLKELEE